MQPVVLSSHFQAKHVHVSNDTWEIVRVKKVKLNRSPFGSASMETSSWRVKWIENMIISDEIVVWIRGDTAPRSVVHCPR
jgi:hypothetical protein